MSTRTEGFNSHSNFDTVQFVMNFGRKGVIKSFQLQFGSQAICQQEGMKEQIRLYHHDMRQFFYRKSKDGYFKKDFLFFDGFKENFTGDGIVFPTFFFYLEEPYEKTFLIEYLIPLFDELNDYHRNHPFFKFSKYKSRKRGKPRGKKSSDNHCI